MSQELKTKSFTTQQLVNDFQERRPIFERFTIKLHSLLEELLLRREIRYSVVERRCKTIDSFREKITREDKRYDNPLAEVSDLCGLRVILYYTHDLEAVGQLIADEFDLDSFESGDKSEALKPHEFGYRSVHYIVSLNPARSGLSEWEIYKELRAEVQVRTVLQHAWASISHVIDYKHELDVPSQLRRQLFRLSALLELADEQFAVIYTEKMRLASQTEDQIDRGELDIELNMDSLREFIASSNTIKAILKAAIDAGFEIKREDDYISECVSQCRFLGVSTIRELEDSLIGVKHLQDEFLKQLISLSRADGSSNWTGSPSFIVMLCLVRDKSENLDIANLAETFNWSKQVAHRVVVASKGTQE